MSQSNSGSNDNDPVRIKKTLQEAETSAFTTQLFYFSMKALFCYILYQYHNILSQQYLLMGLYTLLLVVNVYFILTTGRDPGYEPPATLQLEQQHSDFMTTHEDNAVAHEQDDSFCAICKCKKRIRMKHCYRCGRCVRKFDHHCPWIGACVGEGNHCRFIVMLTLQTLQAVLTFIICFQSMMLYEYKHNPSAVISKPNGDRQIGEEGHSSSGGDDLEALYSPEFGVFAIFSIFMFIYILFVGGLLLFHVYLVVTNSTTTQLMSRSKANYLKGVQGNPFSRGPIENILLAARIPANGQSNWTIRDRVGNDQEGWGAKLGKVWSNQYYDCC